MIRRPSIVYVPPGEPVPLELITNPFHRVYYVAQGWAAES